MFASLLLVFVVDLAQSETISFTTSTSKTKLSGLNFEAPYYQSPCSLTNYTDSYNNNYNWLSLMAIDSIEINIYDNKMKQYNNSNNRMGEELPFIIKTSTSIGLPIISQCSSTSNNGDMIICYNVQTSPLPTVYCNIFDNAASKWSANITVSPVNGKNNAALSPTVLCTADGYVVLYEYVSNYSMFSNKLITRIYYTTIAFDGIIQQNDVPLLTANEYNISSIPYDAMQYLFASNVISESDNSSSFFLLQTTEFTTYGIVGTLKQSVVDILDAFTIIDKTIGFSLYNNPLALQITDDCCYIVAYGAMVSSAVYFNVYDYSGKPLNGMMGKQITDSAYSYGLTELNMLNNNKNGDTYFTILYTTKDNSTGSKINVIDNSVWKISYDSTNKAYKLNNITSTPLSIETEPANYTSYTITPCVNIANNELIIVYTTAEYNQYTPQPIFGQAFTVTSNSINF